MTLIAILWIAGLCEWVARLVDIEQPLMPYDGINFSGDRNNYLECYDPKVTRPYYLKRGGCISYRLNGALIRRENEISAVPNQGTFRILGVGDSFLYGFGVDAKDTFLSLLESRLNRDSKGLPKYEVLNAGRPGADTAQEVGMYAQTWSSLKPDLVILGVHLNDIIPFPTSALIEVHRFYRGKLRERFRSLDWALNRIETKLDAKDKEARLLKSYTQENKSKFLSAVLRLRQRLNDNGGKLLVLFFPVFHQFHNYPFKSIHDDLSSELKGEGIESLDFLPYFLGSDAKSYWITPNDQHPNEIANQIFYERLIEYLRKHPEFLSDKN